MWLCLHRSIVLSLMSLLMQINLQVAASVNTNVSIESVQTDGICAGSEAVFRVNEAIPEDNQAVYTWYVDGEPIPDSNQDTFNAGVLVDGQTVYVTYQTFDPCATEPMVSSNLFTVQTYPLVVPFDLRAESVDAGRINLTWKYNSNQATDFEIERSVGNDQNFETRAILEATTKEFSDEINLLPNTSYFYRIKAINADAAACISAFSDVIGATTDSDGGLVTSLPGIDSQQIKIFPNPSSSGLYQLKWLEHYQGKVKLQLINQLQQLMHESSLEKQTFETYLDLDLQGISSGVYWLKITYGDKQQIIRLIRL